MSRPAPTRRRPARRAAEATSPVGVSVPRSDGVTKSTGAAKYVGDLVLPGMLHGTTVRSTIPAGDIVSVRLDFDPTGFTIVDARHIRGRNVIAAITDDQPCLADGRVRHQGEAILLVAHPDPERLRDVAVHVEYRPSAPALDPERSTVVFKELAIEKGDVRQGFALADAIVEGEYRTGHQEQLYLETNGMLAVPAEDGVTIYGSMQCPFYVHRALGTLLGLPADRVRVVQAETGGGFGGKEDYPSMLAAHAALLALAAGRPVRMIYDRAEDMAATTKRHPSIVRHRTGVTRDGRLTAMDIEVVLDAGAYTTLSPVVLSRGLLHAAGAYRCDHVRIHGRAVMTNTPPNGAFRGFGAPQTLFACEVQMDRVAETLSLDPVSVRERNLLRPGDTMATGQRVGRDGSPRQVLAEAVRRTGFRRRRRALQGTNRGLGLALFLHGAGFTGSGEVKLASRAALELTPRGVRILVANVEMGQGARTSLAQIVSATLGLPLDRVEVAQPDTARVPDSGPTVASRTCMVVGRLLEGCAKEMKQRLGAMTPAAYLRRHGPLVVERRYEQPPGIRWDETTYRGDAYGTYAWGCDVAEVEVDPDTYEVRPVHLTVVHEIGRAINPGQVVGQIEGGTVQGLGYALLEEVVMRDGRMANAQLTNYMVPTTADVPPMDVVVLERPYRHGPFGAKGVGELPMDGPAPAIVNAIRHAGYDVRSIPATPERIFEASRLRAPGRPPAAIAGGPDVARTMPAGGVENRRQRVR